MTSRAAVAPVVQVVVVVVMVVVVVVVVALAQIFRLGEGEGRGGRICYLQLIINYLMGGGGRHGREWMS